MSLANPIFEGLGVESLDDMAIFRAWNGRLSAGGSEGQKSNSLSATLIVKSSSCGVDPLSLISPAIPYGEKLASPTH